MEDKPVEECKIMDAESLRWNVNRFPLPDPAPIAETYEVISVIRLLPNGNSDIVNQLRRAATSISLNIAKSATKTPTSLLSSLVAMLSKLVFKG